MNPVFGGVFWGADDACVLSVALSWRIEELGDALKSHHRLEDFASVFLPAQVNPRFALPGVTPTPRTRF